MLTNVVIFTDSLSSIYLLLERSPSTYLFIVCDIQRIIHELLPEVYVRVQLVPDTKVFLEMSLLTKMLMVMYSLKEPKLLVRKW